VSTTKVKGKKSKERKNRKEAKTKIIPLSSFLFFSLTLSFSSFFLRPVDPPAQTFSATTFPFSLFVAPPIHHRRQRRPPLSPFPFSLPAVATAHNHYRPCFLTPASADSSVLTIHPSHQGSSSSDLCLTSVFSRQRQPPQRLKTTATSGCRNNR